MNRYQKMLLPLIMLLFLIGCAGPKVDLVDQSGRIMPTPHYVLQSTDQRVLVLFYYTAYSVEKDLDGYEILTPKYLHLSKYNTLSSSKCKYLIMNVELKNPTEITYTLWEMVQWVNSEGMEEASGSRVGFSNRKYRSYAIKLPTKDHKKVRYMLTALDDQGRTIMNFGEFRYTTD